MPAGSLDTQILTMLAAGVKPREVMKLVDCTWGDVLSRSAQLGPAPIGPSRPKKARAKRDWIIELGREGKSAEQIREITGTAPRTIRRALVQAGLIQTARQASKVTSEDIAQFCEMLIAGEQRSRQSIVQALGITRDCYVGLLRRVRPGLIESGQMWRCECGDYGLHYAGCSAQTSARRGAVMTADRAERIRTLLLSGRSWLEAMAAEGVTEGQVRRVADHLQPADHELYRSFVLDRKRTRQARIRGLRQRIGSDALARRDQLYARLQDLVPRGVDAALRDDIISEAYVAVLEGNLAEADVSVKIRKFVNAAYRDYASKFGPISLDQAISSDDERSRLEMIEDEGALAAFDDIRLPREFDEDIGFLEEPPLAEKGKP